MNKEIYREQIGWGKENEKKGEDDEKQEEKNEKEKQKGLKEYIIFTRSPWVHGSKSIGSQR
jgi:hypothetical protein